MGEAISVGLSVAADPMNLLYVLIGVLIGTIIGVIPGLGPTATIALLLPISYSLDPIGAVIMLAGIYYGSMYGGTITSVLLRMPGEAASAITAIDGYAMAKKGRSAQALGISAIGSFIGGTMAVVLLMVAGPAIAQMAVRFGPPEYALLMLFGLLMVTRVGLGSTWRSMVAAAAGLLLATVGQDQISGLPRFTFGQQELFDGIDLVIVAMGLFGVAEIICQLMDRHVGSARERMPLGRFRDLFLSKKDLKDSAGPIMRGSALGCGVGVLPAGGGVIASLLSYGLERSRAKVPSRFGRGAIEGVAGPEAANNAAANGSFVPLLCLGLPANGVLALLFGALLIHGITPGPDLITREPDLFWGVVMSMFIGNIFLIVINLPLIGVIVQLLRIRIAVLVTFATVVTLLGVYSLRGSIFDIWLLLIFGVVGVAMNRTGFPPGPFVLAYVLGPLLETAFRQSLLLSDGSLMIFVTRPQSIALIAVIVLFMAWSTWQIRRIKKLAAVQAESEQELESK